MRLLWLWPALILPGAGAQSGFDYGQYYGYLDNAAMVGAAALNPHDPYFAKMRPDAIKAPHGHFQHVAEADPGDDFPFAAFKALNDAEEAAGRPSMLVTAMFAGKQRPVFLSWSLALNAAGRPTAKTAQWAQAVDLRSDRYLQFFIDDYVRNTLWQPRYPNYWVMVDNCSFRYDLYGVLDDDGVFHEGVAWDPPFAANEREFIDSVISFLGRLKQRAPDIHIMGNEGSLTDEGDYPRIWAGFDGSVREDINDGFRTTPTARDNVHIYYRRYQFLASAKKAAILRALLPKPNAADFADKLRTSYVTYLLFQSDGFFYGPRFDDGAARGVPPDAYAEMRDQLGLPSGPAEDRAFGEDYLRLYSRPCEGGIVFLNYSGKALSVPLPGGYFDRAGHPIGSLTIPDMHGDYALKAAGPRAPRPWIIPAAGHLSISSMDGAEVRCTVDGSEPQPDSPRCEGDVSLEAGRQLRAKAFLPGALPSFTAVH